MKEFFVDLALPKTDRAVFVQWAIMLPFWIVTLVATRQKSKDVRLFVFGIAMLNLAWFALRTVH
jgi:hypothetical protein